MKVLVAFEFDGVDPNSPEADKIVAEITESCETMRIGFDATECWVDDAVGKVFFDIEEEKKFTVHNHNHSLLGEFSTEQAAKEEAEFYRHMTGNPAYIVEVKGEQA